MTPQEQQKLESLVTRALRDLPARRAPSSLESRVQAELVRRAALPWWRKSFLHWPVAARAVFVVACGALVQLLFTVSGWFSSGLGAAQLKAAFGPEIGVLRLARSLWDTGIQAADAVVGSISPLWLYGGAAAVVALYVALFGLGAAAYRTLYASR